MSMVEELCNGAWFFFFFPALHSVTLTRWLDISHGGDIYTVGIGKDYESGLC